MDTYLHDYSPKGIPEKIGTNKVRCQLMFVVVLSPNTKYRILRRHYELGEMRTLSSRRLYPRVGIPSLTELVVRSPSSRGCPLLRRRGTASIRYIIVRLVRSLGSLINGSLKR